MDTLAVYNDQDGELLNPITIAHIAGQLSEHEIIDWNIISFQVQNELDTAKFVEMVDSVCSKSLLNVTGVKSYRTYRKLDVGVLYASRSGDWVEIKASGPASVELTKRFADFLDPFIVRERETDDVKIECSYLTMAGVQTLNQIIKCPTLEMISDNYPIQVTNPIKEMLALDSPWKHGKLIIWYGEPGTGKTYAIRSLIREWKEKMLACVITDPEIFLDKPQYYYQIIERFSTDRVIFILEDNADLVMKESRQNNYGLARLLNLTDGIIGQGRDDIFFITFNEEIGKIDPAFLRPGRKLQNLEFTRFSAAEAATWLVNHGNAEAADTALKAGDEMSLAEMYALVNGTLSMTVEDDNKNQVGFRSTSQTRGRMLEPPCSPRRSKPI